MLQSLKSLLGFGAATTRAAPGQGEVRVLVPVQVAPDAVRVPAVPVYPPIDGGIPMVPAEAVVASQDALVHRLRRHMAMPADEFNRSFLQPIHRAAALVGLLPATKDKHFTGQGGLFRMCLETAVFATQAADGVMFASHAAIERRRKVEAAWRHAAFFSGLAVELHRPLTEMLVVAPESGETWNPFMGPLTEWAQQGGHARVHVRWIDQAIQQAGAKSTAVWSLNYLVGQPMMAALHSVDTTIVQTMAGVVTDSITVVDDHPLAKLIRSVRRAAIERDQALKPSLYGALTQGAHLEPWFLDAMRSLLAAGDWTVNEKGSRVNFGKDGCFITWPLGAKDVLRQLQQKNIQGVPTLESTLADMLLTAGIIARAPDGSPFWFVRTAHDPAKEVMVVRVSNPASILAALEVPVAPVDETLLVSAARAPSTPGATPVTPAAPAAPAAPKVQLFDAETGEIIDESQRAAPQAVESGGAGAQARSPGKRPAAAAPGAKAESSPAPQASKPAQPTEPAGEPAAEPASDPRARAGALPEVPPATQDLAALDKQVAAALGPSLAGVIAGWVEDWNASRKPNMMVQVKDGLAVRLELVTKSGLQTQAFIEPLKANGWLHMTEVAGRARQLTKVDFNGQQDHAYTMKTSFAKRCGFVLT